MFRPPASRGSYRGSADFGGHHIPSAVPKQHTDNRRSLTRTRLTFGFPTCRSRTRSVTQPWLRRSHLHIRADLPRRVATWRLRFAPAHLQDVDKRGPSRHAERASDLHLYGGGGGI